MNDTPKATSVTTLTVGDLRRLLKDTPDDVRLGVCNVDNDGWVTALEGLYEVPGDPTTLVLALAAYGSEEIMYEEEVDTNRLG